MTRAGRLRLIVIVTAIAMLETACRTGLIPSITMIPPSLMVVALVDLLRSGKLATDIFATLSNVAIAIILSMLAGVLVGTLIASTLTSSWYTPYLLRRHLDIPLADSWRAIVRPALAISVAGLLVYLLIMWLQAVLPQTLVLFVGTGALAGILLAAFTWLLFLRQSFGIYIPVSLRPLLLVKNP